MNTKLHFFKKVMLMLLLVSMTCLVIILLPLTPDSYRYIAAFINKERAMEESPSPKMIFVGGSSSLHGVDSSVVEKAIEVPVFNTGLYGGLGLQFMLDSVRAVIKPNDLVIVAPEYQLMHSKEKIDYSAWCFMLYEDVPDGFKYFSIKNYIKSLRGFPHYAYTKLFFGTAFHLKQRNLAVEARRDEIDKHADLVVDFAKPFSNPDNLLKQISEMDVSDISYGINLLNEFNTYVNNRGGKVVFIFPPIPDIFYQKNQKIIESINGQLRSRLEIPIIGNPVEHTYPIDWFSDTVYHLNAEGRLARTEKIIEDLKRYRSQNLLSEPEPNQFGRNKALK